MKTINQLRAEIKTLEMEIARLQENCAHSKKEAMMCNFGYGRYDARVVCQDCEKILTEMEISQVELQRVWNEFNKSSETLNADLVEKYNKQLSDDAARKLTRNGGN